MACRSCGVELRSGAKFCDECGTRTSTACGSCGAELRPAAKFCDECGASQAAGAAPQRPAPVVERKVTSVLFGDLVAFTTLSEKHDKEDVRELLSDYFAQCRRIVARYGGTIEKFIGDAVMAVWGVPVAHEDDAERAVRAGLELVRAIETLGEERGLSGLAMRVGIVTGEVAVTLGAEHEGMVAGDAVNTAARVQSVATAGNVWVDENTRLLTSGAITYVDAGSHQLKGKAAPVPLWAVRAVVAAVGGAQRADGLEAPLTGRTRELRMIKELFHGVEETGRPTLVLVNGDPGLGKSRLAWEFEKYIDGLSGSVMWHSTRCLAYGDGVAFWPIAEAVRGRLGLVETDPDADPSAALDAWAASTVPDESEAAWLRPRVLTLLGRTAGGGYAREDLFSAWRTFFERAGQGNPVAIVVDDAQNADEGTVAFFEHLLAHSEAPVFVLLLSRPGVLERWPALATNRRATVLHLATLDPREMAALVDGLVAGVPTHVRDVLIERAQGVPLYAIETVRSLIDRDLVVPRGGVYVLPDTSRVDLATIGAPASLQALVAARLDGLPAAERRVVADASVLGETFTPEAIAALAADVPDLDAVLATLVRAEIFGVVSSRLSAEYGQFRFVQAVVRQVAYATQGRRDRKARHLAVIAYFAGLSDPGGEYGPVLAQHYLDAIEASGPTDSDVPGLREMAVGYLGAAAARARALGGAQDALRYLDTALGLVNSAAESAPLHLHAAWASFDAGEVDLATSHSMRAIQQFDVLEDRLGAGEAAAVLALTHGMLRGDNTAALTIARPHWDALREVRGAEPVLLHLGRAIGAAQLGLNEDGTAIMHARAELAESIGDGPALADALIGLGNVVFARAPTLTGVLYRAAAEIARAEQRPALAAKALGNLAVLTFANDLPGAARLLAESAAITHGSGRDAYNTAMDRANLTCFDVELGAWSEADELVDSADQSVQSLAIGAWVDATLAAARGRPRRRPPLPDEVRATDDEVLVCFILAADSVIARAAGDLAKASTLGLEAATRAMELTGLSDDMTYLWPQAVETAIAARDEVAVATLLSIVDEAHPGRVDLAFRAHRRRFAALLAMQAGASDGVEQGLREAIREFEQWGSPVQAAKARADLARWLDSLGRSDEAVKLRQAALDILEPLDARCWMSDLGLTAASKV